MLGLGGLPALGRTGQTADPYATTPGAASKRPPEAIPVVAGEINVVSANAAALEGPLEPAHRNFMDLWVEQTGPGDATLTWRLDVRDAGRYEAALLSDGKPPYEFEVLHGQRRLAGRVNEAKWQRTSLGTIRLPAGEETLSLRCPAPGSKVSALELTLPVTRGRIDREARSLRSDPAWFKDAGYGAMFQWTNRATPRTGPVKPWNRKVDDFDIPAFGRLIEETGAAYVLWSSTWGQQYISAPIEALDAILPGRTTKRDLLGEMAAELDRRGVKLIFYYHYGYDCYHSKDPEWMRASGGYDADKTRFYENWQKIIGELGERYGDRLHGWFFDGGQRYYNCHFDGSRHAGPNSAPFAALTRTAKRGNRGRIVCYNPWILPSLTPYEDYFCGEGLRKFDGLKDGRFTSGPYAGLQAHTNFPLERRWGHIERDTEIAPPRYAAAELVEAIRHARRNRYPMSMNFEMYEDGSVSPASLELVKEVRRQIRGG